MPKISLAVFVNIMVVLCLIALYAFQIVRLNENDHLIGVYEREIAELRQSLHEMENVYASHSSLSELWPVIHELELEEVREITYINVDASLFAASR